MSAGLIGLAMLVGCGSDTGTGTTSDRAATVAPAPGKYAPPSGLSNQESPAVAPRQGDTGSNPVSTRKEVVTGSVDITAADPIDAAGRIADRVREAGGRIDSRTEEPETEDNRASATLTVRLPADKTDAFIDGLGGLGTVTRVSTNRDDVTNQWQDRDAKIKALQASVDRLRDLMSRAANTADLLAAEQALSARQGELDSLTAQQRNLDEQVALSSLNIEIVSETKESDKPADSFADGLVSGWRSLVDWLKDAVVFTGRALPWLGFLAVLAALVLAVLRGVRGARARRDGTGASAPAQSGSTTTAAGSATAEPAAVTATGETGASGADGGPGDDKTQQP